jgi:hypothetical protein
MKADLAPAQPTRFQSTHNLSQGNNILSTDEEHANVNVAELELVV